MASDLKWRLGFGWGTVVFALVGLVLAVVGDGLIRISGIVLLAISVLYGIAQYRKWNGSPWRRVHFRGQLLYASIAGIEAARARQQARDFDKVSACRQLALTMTPPDRQRNVDAMIDALTVERGSYFSKLLRPRASHFWPSAQPTQLEAVFRQMSDLTFGPDLVLVNIVENTYGPEEAAVYAHAILTGGAR